MRQLEDYQDRYANAILERDKSGILIVRLHSDNDSLVWSESAHRELPLLFADIAADPENRVVILTGTGTKFCADVSYDIWASMEPSAMWAKMYGEGRRLLENLLSIDVPVIGVCNGPAETHSEMVAVSDLVFAADDAYFTDGHFARSGLVPGDGDHVIWPLLLGVNRGRRFLLTGEKISAQEAAQLGVVAEVLPRDRLLPRAREVAEQMAANSTLTLRGTRMALTHRLRRHMTESLGYGLILEARARTAAMSETSRDWTGREHIRDA